MHLEPSSSRVIPGRVLGPTGRRRGWSPYSETPARNAWTVGAPTSRRARWPGRCGTQRGRPCSQDHGPRPSPGHDEVFDTMPTVPAHADDPGHGSTGQPVPRGTRPACSYCAAFAAGEHPDQEPHWPPVMPSKTCASPMERTTPLVGGLRAGECCRSSGPSIRDGVGGWFSASARGSASAPCAAQQQRGLSRPPLRSRRDDAVATVALHVGLHRRARLGVLAMVDADGALSPHHHLRNTSAAWRCGRIRSRARPAVSPCSRSSPRGPPGPLPAAGRRSATARQPHGVAVAAVAAGRRPAPCG